MSEKKVTVFGVYSDQMHADKAVDGLRWAGFRNSVVSALIPDNGVAATGDISSGAMGGALGWLAGIGALAIPGFGSFIAAGPILSALAGAGALLGALMGMGIPEPEARRYEGRVREGGILLSVDCDNSDWVTRAKDILRNSGGEDISSSAES